jgi:hypothetical protein
MEPTPKSQPTDVCGRQFWYEPRQVVWVCIRPRGHKTRCSPDGLCGVGPAGKGSTV